MNEERIELTETENTETTDLGMCWDDEPVSGDSNVGKALLIGGAILAAGIGLAATQRKKIKKWHEDRTIAKAEKILAKREESFVDAEFVEAEEETIVIEEETN